MVIHTRLQETIQSRRAHLDELRKRGIDPYPTSAERTGTIRELVDDFDAAGSKPVTICGRLIAVRKHGGSMFADVDDGTASIQLLIRRDDVGEDVYDTVSTLYDVGDIVQIDGVPMSTKRGERSVGATACRPLAKSLTPLPEKYHGLRDSELRSRKRHLDLIANEDVRRRFVTRSHLIRSMRAFLDAERFLEVETPTLQPIPGGANARPFITHHEELDADFFLRIAPELYLKRLIVGRFERVYEVARCFRNEGIDHDHNPEFTQVECYAAYWEYHEMMSFVERLIKSAVAGLDDGKTGKAGKGNIRFEEDFATLDFRTALLDASGIDIESFPSASALLNEARRKSVDADRTMGRGKIIDLLYKKFVRPTIIKPTFVIDHPVDLSPLAKEKVGKPGYVERFQLLMNGTEVANGWSELNDPDIQRKRFEEQQRLRGAGDDEAQRIDEDYIDALTVGMPPTAGVGIGVDRLTVAVTGAKNVKDAILFPALRPKERNEGGDTEC